MPKNLPNIQYNSDNNTHNVDSPSSLYQIPYDKPESYFTNIESYVNYIKGIETLVRTNDKYSKYIYYLKNTVGLDHCEVLPNIEVDKKGKIALEMHHGPIFTLYDYCEIMLEYFLIKGRRITTPRIAAAILEEHRMNRIQVMMVLSTVHEEIHNRDIFINYRQGFGNLDEFLKIYGIALSDKLKIKLNRYIDKSLASDSDSEDVFKLNDILMKYAR